MKWVTRTLFTFALASPFGGCAHVDTRTAVEHEEEAERHRAAARLAEAQVRTSDITRPMPSAVESMSDPSAPVSQYAGASAARENQTAQEHEDIARKIRDEAAIRCRRVPVAERSSCPLPRDGAHVEPMRLGVRLVPGHAVAGEALRAQIDCALAEAMVDHPEDRNSCPLYTPGAQTRVVDGARGPAVEIVTQDAIQEEELRRRVERYLQPARQGPEGREGHEGVTTNDGTAP